MFLKLWNKLVSIGIDSEIEDQEAIKIRVLNQLSLVGIGFSFLLFFVVLLAVNNLLMAFLNFISIGFGSCILLLNHYKFFQTARHINCFLFPLWVAFSIMNIPTYSIGEPAIFLLTTFLALTQYEGQLKYKVSCIVWHVFLIIGSLGYLSSRTDIYLDPIGAIILLIGLMICLSFLLTYYQTSIQSIVQQKDILVKQLQLKNKELERFAYITSHDLKEPVKNIEGISSLLQKKLSEGETTENVQLMDMINDSAKRMSTLIESILKFSRMEKDDLIYESVDLNTIVQEFKNSHQLFLEKNHAVIEYHDLPQINGNKVSLSLLFQNLLENAIKYNDSDIPIVKIFAYQNEDSIHLVVNDNGIGIKKEYKDYVFEPFRRLQNRSKYKGTGLGLAICKKIVENHSGKIWVESEGVGSQFNIQLPEDRNLAVLN